MEDRNPLVNSVESAGETPENAGDVDAALEDTDEPDLVLVEYEDVDEPDGTPRFGIAEKNRDEAWLTVDQDDLVDLVEAQ